MARYKRFPVFILSVSLFLSTLSSGCGTIINVWGLSKNGNPVAGGEKNFYGGVGEDIEIMVVNHRNNPEKMPIIFATMLVDIPLSFAFDTIFLPYYLSN